MDSTDMELECDRSCETSKIVRDEDTDAKRKTIDVDLDSYGREDVPNPPKIRKNVKQSMVWEHFERLKGDPNDPHAKCKYYGVVYAYHSKRNGTRTMKHHLENCKSLQGCREALVEMIIVDELPFKFVDGLDVNVDFDSNENVGEDFAYDTIVEEFEDDATTPFEQGSSEIDIYLLEANVRTEGDFDILQWWKMNSDRFEVLGYIARDILPIPVSTVASESAFSMGGRVVDSSLCSLAPKQWRLSYVLKIG
ncbi:transposase [Cucumis melo var. makuwa]|uniref:Transposase n=1 Tax=Cucumis melo var. makuwa TaxID=1194695 RepID=A0A5A7UPZ9_CUCMM|nr:transposase [Cucumis melo var. makuwa]